MKRVVFGSIPTAPILCRCVCTSCSFAVGRTRTCTDLYLYPCCCTPTRDSIHHVCIYNMCIYTYMRVVSSMLYTNTREDVDLQLKPLHARSFRAHLIIDRALLLRSGLSRGGSTCWITLLIIIDALSSCIRELSHFLPRLLCGIRASIVYSCYLKELL